MSGDLLPLAVRAYAEARDQKGEAAKRAVATGKRRSVDPARRPEAILVIDCETTVGPEQALLFGCYRYYRVRWDKVGPVLACVAEGLFHADDLSVREPEGFAALTEYARTGKPAIDPSVPDAVRTLRLLSRTRFVQQVFLPSLQAAATVIGFNLPFDLSRIATRWSEARGKQFAGGFSFELLTYTNSDGAATENRFRPRVRVRPIDSKRARIGLARTRPGADPDRETRGRGAFLDLRTLAYALTGGSHSLESACDAFEIGYRKMDVDHGQITASNIDYCREDVAATASLFRALACEYEQHGLQRAPTRVYSPAGLAKGYFREAGILPLLQRQPDFPKEALGYAMAAYYGGRAECRIRRVSVPVSYLDFASMYATVCCLLGLWQFMVCQRVEVTEEDPAATQHWLARVTLDDAFIPNAWKQLCGLVLIEPHGDVVPVRARYSRGGSFGIAVNPLTSSEPLWYTLPDALASTLLTGRAPKVLRAIRFTPAGQASGLCPLRIRGSRPIDPLTDDVFQALVEERRRLELLGDPESVRTAETLKTVASSGSYGISVELNRDEPHSATTPVDVYGLDTFQARVTAVEDPGEFLFPPLGALVTGGARLMLALLERCVTDDGGSYAFCDTDSMAIIASRHGGLVRCPGGPHRDSAGHECVRALSWVQVDQIVERFGPLNPYERTLVPSILELEQENFTAAGERRQLNCFAISAKRYCLYTLNQHCEPELVKWSEHALGGFYLNPLHADADDRGWSRQAWEWILRTELGLPASEPDWLDQPALTRFTASHPRLLEPFKAINRGRPYSEQVKPGNFLLVAHVATGGHPVGSDPTRFALIAPYDPDPHRWLALPWRNIYNPTGPTYRLGTDTVFDRHGHAPPPGVVAVKSYRDVLAAYRVHPEAKSLDPDGRPCTRRTIGRLSRRPVTALSITHVGKEANLLEEIAAGLITAEADRLTTYASRPARQPTETRRCIGCSNQLTRRQKRWCAACRANRRLRERVAQNHMEPNLPSRRGGSAEQ